MAEGCERCDGAMHRREWSPHLQGLGDMKDNWQQRQCRCRATRIMLEAGDGCSGTQTCSCCRGCWAQGCSARLWPEESTGHLGQVSTCGWTASWASGSLPSCFSPGEAWPLNDCFVGVRLNSLRSALTFWRTKYCCCYGEKSRDSLASVYTQTANSNSAVQSTQLSASSSEHLSPRAHWQASAPCLPDWCLRLLGMVWSALTKRAAPLGWGSHVSHSPLTSGDEIIL